MSCDHKYMKVSAAHGREVARWCPDCGFREEVPVDQIPEEMQRRLWADDTDPASLERKRKLLSRYDEDLLRTQLSNMPIGHYHAKDTPENVLYRDGIAVAIIDAGTRTAVDGQKSAGLVAALVHLLNAREQTEITNKPK